MRGGKGVETIFLRNRYRKRLHTSPQPSPIRLPAERGSACAGDYSRVFLFTACDGCYCNVSDLSSRNKTHLHFNSPIGEGVRELADEAGGSVDCV